MDKVEKQILNKIEESSEMIKEFGRYYWDNAETGFKEVKGSKYFVDFCNSLGLKVISNLGITGVKVYLNEYISDRPTIALIGELDALPFPGHPNSNPETGAAHFCGHNAQMAGIMGALIGLNQSSVLDEIDGNIVLMAVPSEEYIDMEFKNQLINKGVIGYGGGKSELIRIGAFDDIDIALGHHISTTANYSVANCSYNGFLTKIVNFYGKASHAAASPELGRDALKAANLAMIAVDQQNESFKDEDAIRVHGYISKGGEAMNIIADKATLEYSVRGKTISSYTDAAIKFDRSMLAGALANGCDVEIITLPGYLPVVPSTNTQVIEKACRTVSKNSEIEVIDKNIHKSGSTDFGDLSHIMPVLQFNTGGYEGNLHECNMSVIDEDLAYIDTARIFALSAYYLLRNNHKEASDIIKSYKAIFTKGEYIIHMDSTKNVLFEKNIG